MTNVSSDGRLGYALEERDRALARVDDLEAENAALRAELAVKSERLQACEQAVAAAVGGMS